MKACSTSSPALSTLLLSCWTKRRSRNSMHCSHSVGWMSLSTAWQTGGRSVRASGLRVWFHQTKAQHDFDWTFCNQSLKKGKKSIFPLWLLIIQENTSEKGPYIYIYTYIYLQFYDCPHDRIASQTFNIHGYIWSKQNNTNSPRKSSLYKQVNVNLLAFSAT